MFVKSNVNTVKQNKKINQRENNTTSKFHANNNSITIWNRLFL